MRGDIFKCPVHQFGQHVNADLLNITECSSRHINVQTPDQQAFTATGLKLLDDFVPAVINTMQHGVYMVIFGVVL